MRLKSTIFSMMALAAVSGTAHANLLSNGSFEVVDGSIGVRNGIALNALSVGNQWDTYKVLPGGWNSDPLLRPVEVQNNTVIAAQDGSKYIELESDPGNSSFSAISQSFTAAFAGNYLFQFYYAPRTSTPGDNLVNALVDNVTVTTKSGVTPAGWTLVSVILGLTAGTHSVGFNALGSIDNTLGGFVDNVSVSAVPLPPAALLLTSAIAGIGYIGRRRKQTVAA